jgi:hypothetical protein
MTLHRIIAKIANMAKIISVSVVISLPRPYFSPIKAPLSTRAVYSTVENFWINIRRIA